MKLRDYQQKAVAYIHASLENHQCTLAVMPTGSGKTEVFIQVIHDRLPKGRALVLAHRQELIDQAAGRISRTIGVSADIEMGESRADHHWFKSPVVVGSIQTQIAGHNGYRRMQKFDPNEFATLIVDEAHHAVSASYRAVIDYYRTNPELRVLGVTATPDRADERALGIVFQDVIPEYGLIDAINDGWLVEPEVQIFDVLDVDFSRCIAKGGRDFNPQLLSHEMSYEKPLHAVTGPVIEIVGNRKSVIFACEVQHAERIAEILNRAMPGTAAALSYKTPPDKRLRIMADYRSGTIRHLVNVGIIGEGVDVPDIEVVVQARPTKSRALSAQQIGRGTRPVAPVDNYTTAEERKAAIAASFKPKLLVLDFVGNAGQHKLITALDVLGGNYEDDVIELARRKKRDGPIGVLEALREAEEEAKELRRKALEESRSHLQAKVRYRTRTIDPFDVLDILPQRERGWWKGQPITEPQLRALQQMKIPDADDMTKTRASQLIGTLFARRKKGLCSYRQSVYLRQFGYDPTLITFKQAGEILTAKFGKR